MNRGRRNRPAAIVIGMAVAGVIGLAAGCREPAEGEFKEYDELHVSSDQPLDEADSAARPEPAEGQRTDADPAAGPIAEAGPFGQPVSAPIPTAGSAASAAAGADPPASDAAASQNNPRPLTTAQRDAIIAALNGGQRPPSFGTGGPTDPAAGKQAPAEPRKVELLVKHRQFTTVGPEDALRVSYDDIDLLKVLNMEPVTPDAPKLMPDWLTGLDGRRIRIRGFMVPQFQETGITRFVLARDNQICCFGRDPKPYDVIEVTLRKGVTTRYIQNRPFDVVGVFQISPEIAAGEVYGLYKIDDAVIIER